MFLKLPVRHAPFPRRIRRHVRPGWVAQRGDKMAVGSLEPGVLRHDKACCAGQQKIKGLVSERAIITVASFFNIQASIFPRLLDPRASS